MNILITGAGAIGIAVGAGLASVGQQVSFFARGETQKAIEADGVHRTGTLTYDTAAGHVRSVTAP